MNAEAIAHALGAASRSGSGWRCRCPSHEDGNPSLSVSDGENGKALWHCHAGCTQEAVTEALQARGLIGNGDAREHHSPFQHAKLGEPTATWTYRNADGRTAFIVARYETLEGKEMRPWRPNGAGFECKGIPAPRPLYRLPELLAGKNKPVLLVEGEKCADAAARVLNRYAATTWPGGAKATKDVELGPLRGRKVVIWPDADPPGRKAAAEIADRLRSTAREIRVVEVQDRPEGWDIADAIAEGWTEADVETYIEERAQAVERSPSASRSPRLVSISQFVASFVTPEWVLDRILQRRYVYALTAFWGHGKTAIMLAIALHVAAGRALGPHRVQRQRVAFLCGENVDDVKLRVRMTGEVMGLDLDELEPWLYFTEAPFAIDDPVALEEFITENEQYAPFGLLIIDTGPAHSAAEEENDNRQQHALAMALRHFLHRFGEPCVVALMHPAKGATKDNMQPRGGGAFSGAVDGELCAWMDTGSDMVEFYHRTKFRGPGFKAFCFRLEKRELVDVKDNFGNPVVTVLATLTDEQPTGRAGRRGLTDAEKLALDALRSCLANHSGKAASVPADIRRAAKMGRNTATLVETWRQDCYAVRIGETPEAQKKAFQRIRTSLQADKIIAIHEDYAWIPGEPYAGSE
jgi:hypothetical protein